MLICAIDTSGKEGSVALAEGDAESFRVLHLATIAGGTYSAQLIPEITRALEAGNRAKPDIRLLVAASGPGSFTGLRVGLSTVKALAEAFSVPVVAISVLEAIAYAIPAEGLVMTALDAQRGEVFVGEYRSTAMKPGARTIEMIHEALLPREEFASWLKSRKPVPVTHTPDATVELALKESGMPVELVPRPAADAYVGIGLQKFYSGQTTCVDLLDANYIRRSDAEIFGPSNPNTPRK